MSRLSLSLLTLVCLSGSAVGLADSPEKNKGATKEEPSRISSSVNIHPAAEKLTSKESREVSFAAGRLLKHVAQARAAIADKKMDDAKTHVGQGLKLVAIIDNVLPHFTVKTEIKSGDLVYEDDDDVEPQYVTVFDELEHRSVVAPISTAKQEAERKAQSVRNSLDKKADSSTKSVQTVADQAPLVVRHADIDYSALKLNLRLADRMLHVAEKQLADSKFDAADLALLTLQASGVVFEYDEIDLPLEEAADNLKIAERELKAGHHAPAVAALNVAIDELKRYEATVGENRGKEVKQLHEEINQLTAELAKGNMTMKKTEKHASTVSKWWDKVTSWFRKN